MDPDERWQTASDLSIPLQWIAEAGPVPASGQAAVDADLYAPDRRRQFHDLTLSIGERKGSI
jgi:hypothetical protein